MTDQEEFEQAWEDASREIPMGIDKKSMEVGWDYALDWVRTEPKPVGYWIETVFDNGMKRVHFSQTQDIELAHGERVYELRALYFSYRRPFEPDIYQALDEISNLLTHSRPEDYAEVINKCMMIADVAISDWESEK